MVPEPGRRLPAKVSPKRGNVRAGLAAGSLFHPSPLVVSPKSTPISLPIRLMGQVETVKYQVLDSMLLNEVQRQQKEVGDLRHQNPDLQERLARLEAAMASLPSEAGVQ